jgi:resuscitation-promoting factor RpfA
VFPPRGTQLALPHSNHRCNNFVGHTEAPSSTGSGGIGKGASVRMNFEVKALTVMGALGIVAALTVGAPAALADPVPLVPGPAPVPAPEIPVPPGPAPGPAPGATIQAAAADQAPTPPEGVPHLSSPENLPPGTTDTPPDGDQPRGLTYLRDIWHAYQTQEVSGRDALLLLTQRPLDPNAAPPPGMSSNPTPPLGPDAVPPPVPEPAPPLLFPPPAPAP